MGQKRRFVSVCLLGVALGGVVLGSACSLTTSLEGLTAGPLPTDASDGGSDGSKGDGAAVDAATDAGTPRSCKDLLGTLPPATDGYYRIDPDRARPDFEVYCDMTTAGGGWMLVGRSVKNQYPDFGWLVAAGSVRDDGQPYSLGPAVSDVSFSEILIGTRDSGKKLTGDAYTFIVGTSFLTATATSAVPVTPTSLGTCAPPGGPDMMHHAGYTSSKRGFFFRDLAPFEDVAGGTYGLLGGGFAFTYGDCNAGGNLNETQGELFVR